VSSSLSIGSPASAFFVALVLFACGEARGASKPLPASELLKYQSCKADEDCMWITNGCCDCGNGGIEVAIARSQEAAFRAQFQCTHVPCTTMGRTPVCGTGSVHCEAARCVFHAQKK